jgi:serine/threonine-protein kinase
MTSARDEKEADQTLDESDASQPSAANASSAPLPSGIGSHSRLGKYEILKKIGAGGMGSVYLALDTQLKRTVALKVLPKEQANNPTLVRRFQSEAQAAARLRHDHIVTIYEAGESNGFLYIALEFIDGIDIQKLLKRDGTFTVERSIDVIRQVCDALQHAYKQGIIHRDIKPSNLLIDQDDVVKLTDMGLARSVDETIESNITRAGTTVGTVDYMAPEQARDSRAADIRSDMYSLGCTWYELLTGEAPFRGGSLTNKLYAHIAKPRPNPRDKNPSIPKLVVDVMHRMMAKSPKNRYQTPQDLLADLDRLASSDLSDDEDHDPALDEAIILEDDGSDPEVDVTTDTEDSWEQTSESLRLRQERISRTRDRQAKHKTSKLPFVIAGVALVTVLVAWLIASGLNASSDENSGQDDGKVAGTDGEDSSDDGPSGKKKNDRKKKGKPGPRKKRPGKGPKKPIKKKRPNEKLKPKLQISPRITIARESERSQIPVWVAECLLPDEAVTPRGNIPMSVVTVGRDADGPSVFNSLGDALQNIARPGRIIHLVGDGPFVLNPVALSGRGHVVLAAAGANLPVIVLVDNSANSGDTFLSAADMELTLVGVHLAYDARQSSVKEPKTLIASHGGRLVMRRCSVTVLDDGSHQTAAVSLFGPEPGQALLDRVIVRGNGVTALAIDHHAVDVTAADCLFATGNAPLITIHGDGSGERDLRFFSCTMISDAMGIDARPNADSPSPPKTSILTSRCLITTPATGEGTVLLSVAGWPLRKSTTSTAGTAKGLTWQIDSSLFLGWNELVRMGPAQTEKIQGYASWRRFWKSTVPPTTFQPVAWPSGLSQAVTASTPRDIDAIRIPVQPPPSAGSTRLGNLTDALSVPSPSASAWAEMLTGRPRPPASFLGKPSAQNRLEVNLDDVDLGQLLANGDWPTGTVIVLSGSGRHPTSPIRVVGKSLRIEFHPETAKTLELVSRTIEQTQVNESIGAFDAFFSVKNGQLQIVNGRFHMPGASVPNAPEWFMHVTDGDFLLQNCEVRGPVSETPLRHKGLIRWTTSRDPIETEKKRGQYEHDGVLRDCFLASSGRVISFDARGNGMSIHNSVLVGVDKLIEIEGLRSDTATTGAIDISQCTITTSRDLFDLRTTAAANVPIQITTSNTVFAPPVPIEGRSAAKPILLRYYGSQPADRNLRWWGYGNGYAAEFKHFLSGSQHRADKPQDFKADWASVWGVGQVQRGIAGQNAVVLAKPYSNVATLGRADFLLKPACRAFMWKTDGFSIGATETVDAVPVTQPKK